MAPFVGFALLVKDAGPVFVGADHGTDTVPYAPSGNGGGNGGSRGGKRGNAGNGDGNNFEHGCNPPFGRRKRDASGRRVSMGNLTSTPHGLTRRPVGAGRMFEAGGEASRGAGAA